MKGNSDPSFGNGTQFDAKHRESTEDGILRAH